MLFRPRKKEKQIAQDKIMEKKKHAKNRLNRLFSRNQYDGYNISDIKRTKQS